MSQIIPIYSPRILHIKVYTVFTQVIRAVDGNAGQGMERSSLRRPLTRDYRYKWQYNVRDKFGLPEGPNKPGNLLPMKEYGR